MSEEVLNNPWVVAIVLWDLLWKGIALYKAGKLKDKVWFVLILILNTAGILPICYILFKKDVDKS